MSADSAPVAVGDTVKVFDGNRGSRDGTVVKVGPKLVHIDVGYGHVERFLHDGRRRDGYPGHFRTLAQVADSERFHEATKKLAELGIEIGWRGPKWTTDQLAALAEAARAIHTGEVTS